MLELYYGVFTGKRFTMVETKRVGQLYFSIGLVLGVIGIIFAITTMNMWGVLIPVILSYFHIIIGMLYLSMV
jgi:hypothetical protein